MLTDNVQPPTPDWLLQGLDQLKKQYPRDQFEPLMKHTAIDPTSNIPVPATDANRHFPHKYLPRIKCLDCPGKVYVTAPGATVENFESHLKNRKHKEMVEARLAKEGQK